jgi:hypothetical protein
MLRISHLQGLPKAAGGVVQMLATDIVFESISSADIVIADNPEQCQIQGIRASQPD